MDFVKQAMIKIFKATIFVVKWFFIGCVVLFGIAYTCTSRFDKCRDYSDYTCSQIEKADYYIWFRFPDSTKDYNLGLVSGLSQCGNVAHSYAASKGMTRNTGWSYVCCMIAEGSNCYEKHR